MDILDQADELLSSTDHTIGHSSGHGTVVSNSSGTIGHGAQKEEQAAQEIVRGRTTTEIESAAALDAASNVQDPSPTDDSKANAIEAGNASPTPQDTPDTRAGSEIWTSFHVDRSSNASTTSTWSHPSADDSHRLRFHSPSLQRSTRCQRSRAWCSHPRSVQVQCCAERAALSLFLPLGLRFRSSRDHPAAAGQIDRRDVRRRR